MFASGQQNSAALNPAAHSVPNRRKIDMFWHWLFWIGVLVVAATAIHEYVRYTARTASDEWFKRKETHATRVRDIFKEEE